MDLNRRVRDIGQETPAATLPPRDLVGFPTEDVAEPEDENMEDIVRLDPMEAVVSGSEERCYYDVLSCSSLTLLTIFLSSFSFNGHLVVNSSVMTPPPPQDFNPVLNDISDFPYPYGEFFMQIYK